MTSIPPIADGRAERRRRIAQAGSLEALLNDPGGRTILEDEASEPDAATRLITKDQLDYLLLIHNSRRQAAAKLGLSFAIEDVIVVPGFMGSSLRDTAPQGFGLIWISPGLVITGTPLSALKLASFQNGLPDQDAAANVHVEAPGPIPAVYDLLTADLTLRFYSPEVYAYDWRKDLERSAILLADKIRGRLGRKPRPLHVIAHSQGTLVARRAIQLLGADQARRLINNLVLLGPASFGTFSAAFAIAGSAETLDGVRKYGAKIPEGFPSVLQSFTGLYQLLPWNPKLFNNGFDPEVMKAPDFWKTGKEPDRLKYGFGWGGKIDTTFFDDRTAIILGDQPTVGAVKFVGDTLVADGPMVPGDGTVPDSLARLPGVRTYRAAGADHMMLPMNLAVLSAVRAILKGDSPSIAQAAPALRDPRVRIKIGLRGARTPTLAIPGSVSVLLAPPPATPPPSKGIASARGSVPEEAIPPASAVAIGSRRTRLEPPTPSCRRLRVFSFDPLLATNLDTLEIARITIEVPWESDIQLKEGPVGEYVEVVDYDPASQCFYAPVDLTHPRLTARDGLPPSEANPQFHQQMTYAVAMATIDTFEKSLGRVALWAPHFERDQDGNVVKGSTVNPYVPRLRIYPHALREANAYYDPDRHALLFGYFPSREQPGGNTMPGGTVFTCQSFDIVAHETTHALLHGLHRYFLHPSNPDLLAFHEAFADVVAVFQHFSHPDVVRHQVAKTRGDLKTENLLGQLAQQFGQAMGDHRGSLRRYIDTVPDPTKYGSTDEPHDRGAILMAALFRAFQNIYEARSKDLYRIATGGTGKLPDGDIHPDLVNRLAHDVAKSARHVLIMCVRALDYVPPVDLTFGEYLRALITADFDLVKDDNRGYRVSVIDAFRSWGIYPSEVNVLDEASLVWSHPDSWARDTLQTVVRNLKFNDWTLRADRRQIFQQMQDNGLTLRKWLYDNADQLGDGGKSLGLFIFGKGSHSIPRNDRNNPKFEVHSVRPCCRIGPDGQQCIDLVAEIVQRRAGYFDPDVQKKVDDGHDGKPWLFLPGDQDRSKSKVAPPKPDFWFQGGCTLLINPESGEIRYCVTKCVRDDDRLARQREFAQTGAIPSAAMTYFGGRERNPFALVHTDD